MKNIITRPYYFLIFLLLLFSCFQNVSIVSFSGFSFKFSHFIALIGLFPLIKSKNIKLPPYIILLFFGYIIAVSSIMYLKYEFNSLILNYLFGLYYIILIINLGFNFKKDEIIRIINLAASIVLTFTLLKIIMNINVFIDFFRHPYNHPDIYTFFGGGVNLEATWIALLGFSFDDNKKGYLYLVFSFLISALYASRVGIIANILLTIYLLSQNRNIFTIKSLKTLFTFLILTFIGFWVADKFGMLDYIFNRFTKIGDESGSMERLDMWNNAFRTFINNPMGYGLGNALLGIKLVTGNLFSVTNIHNMFLQMLLDTGIMGFVYYVVLNIYFIVKNRNKLMKDSIVSFIFAYIIISFIQFRGGDSILFIMIGFYLQMMNNEKFIEKNSR